MFQTLGLVCLIVAGTTVGYDAVHAYDSGALGMFLIGALGGASLTVCARNALLFWPKNKG